MYTTYLYSGDEADYTAGAAWGSGQTYPYTVACLPHVFHLRIIMSCLGSISLDF